MLKLFENYRRQSRAAWSAGLGTPLLIAFICMIPKPEAEGSPVCFWLTVAVFAVALVGLSAFLVCAARAHQAKQAFAYHGAPKAILTTVSFLADERRSAMKNILPVLQVAVLCAALATLSQWPQLVVLAPFCAAFVCGFFVSTAFLSVMLFGRRRNWINGLFLVRYLWQQLKFIGFRPRAAEYARTFAANLAAPAVSNATATSFKAAGFVFEMDDFYKNAIIIGQTGSGKTFTILSTLLEGMFATSAASALPAAGCLQDPKGDYKHRVLNLARRYDREADLYILSATDWALHGGTSRAIRLNLIPAGEDSLEIAVRFVAAQRMAGGLKSNDSFFPDATRTFLRRGIDLIRGGQAEPPSLSDLLRLATEFADVKKGYYARLCRQIFTIYPKGQGLPPLVKEAMAYFQLQFKKMPDRQLGGVVGTISQIVDDFSAVPFNDMMSGSSTITISEIIDTGKLLYVDLPLANRPRISRLICALIKLEFQQQILRRVDKERPSFYFCDEFPQLWVTGENSGDADFFALSRASRHANIIAAQNLSSFYKQLPNNHDETRNFLGNLATKIFLRNTEAETNIWASKLFGDRTEITVGASESASLNDGFKRGFTTYNRSTASVPTVPAEAFINLAIPIRELPDRHYAESIVHLAGRGEVQKLDLVWPINVL